MSTISRRQLVLAATASLAAPMLQAQDATYPNKPIRWLVSYPAGGGADWFTRVIAERVSTILRQPIIVDNRPGASGTIALAALAQAPADGYTLITGDVGTVTMSPLVLKSIPYDPIKAFTPVTGMAKGPFIWVVHSNRVPVNTFREFVEFAKKQPGKLSYGSFGEGSLTHLMTELLCTRTGMRLLHVPYKGAAPAQQDLLGGNIDAMFAAPSMWKAMEPSGRARALGSSLSTAIPQLPGILPIQEQGVADFDVAAWQGALVPAGTPAAVVERLRAAIHAALADPALVRLLVEQAYVITPSSPAELDQEMRAGTALWKPVVAGANISMQ